MSGRGIYRRGSIRYPESLLGIYRESGIIVGDLSSGNCQSGNCPHTVMIVIPLLEVTSAFIGTDKFISSSLLIANCQRFGSKFLSDQKIFDLLSL